MAKWITADGVTTEVAPANGKSFTLEEMQRYVGGYIEALYMKDGAVMWLNEDGKRLELPANKVADEIARKKARIAPWDWIVGNVLIATLEETGDDDEDDSET